MAINRSAVLLACGSVLVNMLLAVQSSSMASNFAQKKAEFEKSKIDLKRLDAIVVDSKNQKVALMLVSRSLPNGFREVASAISDIEAVAKSTAVALETRIDEEARKEPMNVSSILLTMKTTGSFTATSTFLTNVSKLALHSRVESITFDSSGGLVNGIIVMKLFIDKL